MTQFIRYLTGFFALLVSVSSFAVDHITCTLSSNGISEQVQPGQDYSNTYTCTNTYPGSFPAIQLGLQTIPISGKTASIRSTGSCATAPLASGNSCQFNLIASFEQSASFDVNITVGSLYFLAMGRVTATISPVASISWPGFNSGIARADNSGNGTGAFIANATDSSGHPVIYTFAVIEGPGTITGSQNGSFSLSSADASTKIRITATSDDASPVAGTPISVVVNNIPLKIIAFYNNSTETIYPVIEAPILTPADPWLQAQFQITNLVTYTFESTNIYRAYVNSMNGVPPGQSVFVAVPFYSELSASPSGGSIPDQYVDWWNAMRVYIYDVQSALIQQYNADSVNPVTLYTDGPSCLPSAVCSQPLPVFSSHTGVAANAPLQLTEYTFADVVTSVGVPYPIDLTHVDYDYSGVDQIYLPIAMEPYGSSLVGYTGTVVDLASFRNSMNDFLNDTGWPTYTGLPYPRIPGAYNVIVANPDLTEPEKSNTTALLSTNYANCVNNVAAPNHAECVLVNNLFLTNYTQCFGAGAPTLAQLIPRVYGWVAFTGACGLNPLASTPGYSAAETAYHTLQYFFNPNYAGDFNPYVQLVHVALAMNVYAYSIDDAVGNINTIGNGIVITMGGANGLSNPLQYNTANITTVGPGTPPPLSPDPVFTRFGVCSSTASSGSLARGAPFSFQIPANQYPCEITLEDSNNVLYHFTVLSSAPFTTPPTSNYISCAVGDNWCAGVVIDFNTHVNIGTPVPNL